MALNITNDFQSSDTLITAQEVVLCSPLSPEVGSINHALIINAEERIFRKCMGYKFYNELMADRRKYVRTDAIVDTPNTYAYTSFKEGTVYQVGKYVLKDGVLWKVKVLTTGSQIPPNREYFQLAERFINENYEYLWQRYLRNLLAFETSAIGMPYRAVQDTGKGLLRKYDDGSTMPAKQGEIAYLQKNYQGDIDTMIANMEAFIYENKSEFPNYLKFSDENLCGKGCNKRRVRHYGFNTK